MARITEQEILQEKHEIDEEFEVLTRRVTNLNSMIAKYVEGNNEKNNKQ